jgi:hypothetical protein
VAGGEGVEDEHFNPSRNEQRGVIYYYYCNQTVQIKTYDRQKQINDVITKSILLKRKHAVHLHRFIFIYPFLVLRILSPDSIITTYTPSSPSRFSSCSWSADGCSTLIGVSSHCGSTHCQKCRIFTTLKTPENLES